MTLKCYTDRCKFEHIHLSKDRHNIIDHNQLDFPKKYMTMKRIKTIVIALLLLGALVASTTGCAISRGCQATKIGNHR